MKKLLVTLIAFLVILSGCSTTPTHKVTLLENDGVSAKKEVSNPTEGYKTLLYNGSPYFSTTKKEFIAEVNRRAAEKGYAENSVTMDISELFGGIDEIEFKMQSKTEEDAKRNGDYLYILMDMFSPGMQELIADELGFFMDIPDDKYYAASLICGSTTYSSYVDKSSTLRIKPSKLPEPPKVPAATKPK